MRTTVRASVTGLSAAVIFASAAAVAAPGRPWTGYKLVPRNPDATTTFPINAGAPTIIYLNHTGGTFTPGNDDARTNRSSIPSRTSTVPAWNISTANWNSVRDCIADEFSRFNVTIVDTDPGNVPHYECVIAGSPEDVQMQQGVGGVSPWTDDCSVIPNSIVYVFAEVYGNAYQEVCETAGQEISHSFGLDHEYLAADPMTYLNYNGHKTFQDQLVSCGEYSARACQCSAKQNSVQMLIDRIGAKTTQTDNPPTVSITSPASGATVAPGFTVNATASDDLGVAKVELRIDGTLVGSDTSAPYSFTAGTTLGDGAHTLIATATDTGGNTATSTVSVTQMTGGGGSGSGSGSGGGSGSGSGGGSGSGSGGGSGGGSGSGSGSGSDDGSNPGGDDPWLAGGCAAGGGGGGAMLIVGLGLALSLRRRRR